MSVAQDLAAPGAITVEVMAVLEQTVTKAAAAAAPQIFGQ
jgi:hypothetical protein